MKAFQHLNKFDGRSSFATWFTRIGINSALMILRKKRRGVEISMDATEEGEAWQRLQIPDHSADPEQQCAGRERSVHLKRAIGALPSALRVVVERAQFQEDFDKTDCPRNGHFDPGCQVPDGSCQRCSAQVHGLGAKKRGYRELTSSR